MDGEIYTQIGPGFLGKIVITGFAGSLLITLRAGGRRDEKTSGEEGKEGAFH